MPRQYPGFVFAALLGLIIVAFNLAVSGIDHQRLNWQIKLNDKLTERVDRLEVEVDVLLARIEDLTDQLPAKPKRP